MPDLFVCLSVSVSAAGFISLLLGPSQGLLTGEEVARLLGVNPLGTEIQFDFILDSTFLLLNSWFADEDQAEALLERSRSRMRRVPLSNVTLELLQRKTNGTAKEMQELSEPCDLDEVDFFIR